MTNMQYLLLGTAVVWIGTFLYVVSLIRRQNQTLDMIKQLKQSLEDGR
ncbi:MAG: CcmD family protein [Kyrpidia sp.]|nr:CcmD family protein [Kyrpidia sp.]